MGYRQENVPVETPPNRPCCSLTIGFKLQKYGGQRNRLQPRCEADGFWQARKRQLARAIPHLRLAIYDLRFGRVLDLEHISALLEKHRLRASARVKEFSIGGKPFHFNSQPAVMGVINCPPFRRETTLSRYRRSADKLMTPMTAGWRIEMERFAADRESFTAPTAAGPMFFEQGGECVQDPTRDRIVSRKSPIVNEEWRAPVAASGLQNHLPHIGVAACLRWPP